MAQTVDERTRIKWRQLVDRIILATHNNQIIWQPAINDDEFLTNLRDKIVTIGYESGGTRIYYFRIDDDFGGAKIDFFNDEDLDENFLTLSGESYFSRLRDFYNSLSRKVSGADEVLDELLSALPSDDSL